MKFKRPGRGPSGPRNLSGNVSGERAERPPKVADVADAPLIAPRVPLSPSEVRTILGSLMLTMFLAALDQTIVASSTMLPTCRGSLQRICWRRLRLRRCSAR